MQPARFGLDVKHNPGLFQKPRIDADVVQCQRANGVMLFSGGAGFVALEMRHHAHGHLQPLGQATAGAGGA